MTVKELWKATTADIYLARQGKEPLKLPSGGRLQIEHAKRRSGGSRSARGRASLPIYSSRPWR